MVLLNTNAQHIFVRPLFISYPVFMFAFSILDDEAAVAYAHAFCLPAFDASSLNELVLDSTNRLHLPNSFRWQRQYSGITWCIVWKSLFRTTETD